MKDFKELKNKKLWLFDMDGTIYLGNKIFNGTLDFFGKIKAHNSKYIFITNNSSKGKCWFVYIPIGRVSKHFDFTEEEWMKAIEESVPEKFIEILNQ